MYVAVSRLSFNAGSDSITDGRELRALGDRLRKRFKVCVRTDDRDGNLDLVIAALHHRSNDLRKLVDDIVDDCEKSGFGRVEHEETSIDLISRDEDTETETWEE